MLAEKDDWVPRNVAPFIWINQFGNETSTSTDTINQPYGGMKTSGSASTSSNGPEHKLQKAETAESSPEPTSTSSDSIPLPLSSTPLTIESSMSLEELKMPLLENDKPQETRDLKEVRTPSLQNDKTT